MSNVFMPFKREKLFGPIPWGYTPDATDPYLLIPNQKELEALEKAKKYLDEGASFVSACKWIEQECGRKMSAPTLLKYYENDETREEGKAKRSKLVKNFTENHGTKRKLQRDEAGKISLKITKTKKTLTAAQKRLEKLKKSKEAVAAEMNLAPEPVIEEQEEPVPAEPLQPAPDVSEIIRPNPGPQTDFLAASEREVLFGGAAGPGKSWALNVDPLRTVHFAAHRAITFRRTNDELRELIWMTKELYPKVIPGAKFQEQKSTWVFPNGGTHWFRYLDRDEDVLSMQGQSYTWIGFDELTQWHSPFVFNYMRSRLRTVSDEIRPFLAMRATSNPGGPGHQWVKRTFVDPAVPNTAFPATDIETGEDLVYPPNHPKAGQPLFYRRFIPAKLSDNPHLVKDTDYEANLLSLPEVQRKQLLEGNWDIADGAAFPEFDRNVHVCAPFEIPSNWTKFRACDWGYDQPFCVLWFAVDENGVLYVYRELYGRKKVSSVLADMVLAAEAGENISYGILDSHCWDKKDGNATVEESMRHKGCFWRPAANSSKNSRLPTKQELHRRLQVVIGNNPVTGEPIKKSNVVIFNTCVNLIRTLPSIPLDKTSPEDVDTKCEDHAYDAFRYGCASRPLHRMYRPPVAISPKPSRPYNRFGFPS